MSASSPSSSSSNKKQALAVDLSGDADDAEYDLLFPSQSSATGGAGGAGTAGAPVELSVASLLRRRRIVITDDDDDKQGSSSGDGSSSGNGNSSSSSSSSGRNRSSTSSSAMNTDQLSQMEVKDLVGMITGSQDQQLCVICMDRQKVCLVLSFVLPLSSAFVVAA